MTEKNFGGIYRGLKVLVTGHTGFKGAWMSEWLTLMGADAAGFSLVPPTEPALFDVIGLSKSMRHTVGDIRDHVALEAAVTAFKPDIVFHMAAQPLVRLSYREPRETYETNVIGTLNVLEAVRKTPSVRACVVITTDKCYENREWEYGYREVDPLGGYDPYSSSKACSEIVTAAYRRSFFNPDGSGVQHPAAIASARAGNVIGGGDWALDRLVPDCARSISAGKSIVLRNPRSTRPWQHVLEPLSGYLWLGAKLLADGRRFSSAWNFGPYDESVVDVEKVVRLAIAAWGKGKVEVSTDPQPHEANLLKLDISKAQASLAWKPVYTVAEAVSESVRWYREFYEKPGADMAAFTRDQIGHFAAKAREAGLAWSV